MVCVRVSDGSTVQTIEPIPNDAPNGLEVKLSDRNLIFWCEGRHAKWNQAMSPRVTACTRRASAEDPPTGQATAGKELSQCCVGFWCWLWLVLAGVAHEDVLGMFT
jgi:hypothetical protein